MKLFYQMHEYTSGKHRIVTAVYDKDFFSFDDTTNNTAVFEVDEVFPDNKTVCLDIKKNVNKTDIDGDNKYYIGSDGNLYEKEGWQEYVWGELI